MRWLERIPDYIFLFILLLVIPTSTPQLDQAGRIAILSGGKGFDALTWTIQATWVKIRQASLTAPQVIPPAQQRLLVLETLRLTEEIEKLKEDINLLHSDPSIQNPKQAAADLRQQLAILTHQQNNLAPFAESILEGQVSQILVEQGFTLGGQPLPWVLYHVTPLPQYLVISPREKIEQTYSALYDPSLTLEEIETIEETVANAFNVSTMMTEVGGLAAYPTMIMRTTSLEWLTDTIAHEWIHIYLYAHPLGQNYSADPAVRTMNETAASIVGSEIGKMVMERYYPEKTTRAHPSALQLAWQPKNPAYAPTFFDFRHEMHITRITADALLAEGKIAEAEAYMNARREFFWQNGYALRKLNQAYFAFHGAYADTPGGAAGEDPVGPAVRELRAQSPSLLAFIQTIAQMDSFDDLQNHLSGQPAR